MASRRSTCLLQEQGTASEKSLTDARPWARGANHLSPDIPAESAVSPGHHHNGVRRFCLARVKKLKTTRPVLAASLVVIRKQCGRPGCRCQRGQKHPGHYLTFKEKGKTRTV